MALALPLLRGVDAAKCPSTDGFSAANIPTTNPGLLSFTICSGKTTSKQRHDSCKLQRVLPITNQIRCYYLNDIYSYFISHKTLGILFPYLPHTPLVYPAACLALLSRNWRECVTCFNSLRWLVSAKPLFTIRDVWFIQPRCTLFGVSCIEGL